MRRTGSVLACLALVVPALALAAEPKATTEPIDAEAIEQDYALVSGIVNPGGVATSYYFEYGTTTDYGQQTPTIPIGSGKNDVGVDVGLDELTPNTTYHYRIVATYKPTSEYTAGVAFGADETFTTLAVPPALALSFKNGKKVSVGLDGLASFTLACTGVAGKKCEGKLKLKGKIKLGKGKPKLRTFGSALYSIKAGKSKTVDVKVAKPIADAIAAKKSGKQAATATAKTRSIKTPVTQKVTLVADRI